MLDLFEEWGVNQAPQNDRPDPFIAKALEMLGVPSSGQGDGSGEMQQEEGVQEGGDPPAAMATEKAAVNVSPLPLS